MNAHCETICVTHINHCHTSMSTAHLRLVLRIRKLHNSNEIYATKIVLCDHMFKMKVTEPLEAAHCWSLVGILARLMYPFIS